uniref:Reverse transcriptase domain-containing protein n=1 Tax=Tanacetum cinerariifolium TaxID=118510 RepID=A0A6L2KMN0_TANCI|nr:reverse transcriptase domain-containing protein [Tanacetum cinerariifolium]
MIVSSPSQYNGIIGRPEIREIQAVPSTTHGMLKFSMNGGIVTIRSTILTPTECTTIAATPKDHAKKAEPHHENFKVAIHPDFPDQEITIGGTISIKARTKLCTLLKKNLDIFAWQPSDMTGVPRLIFEHRLNIQEGYSPVRFVTPFQKSIGRSNPPAATPLKKSLILFNTLKKCIKKSDFQWTLDAKQAFKQLKQYLAKLPMPVAPKPKGELIMYLSASYGAISAVLMTERDIVRTPVYFILADFLIKKPNDASPEASMIETPQEPWILFTDESSCVNGSEYKVLIACLWRATQMGVCNVHVSIDSKLVANQVLGIYVAKEYNMVKYLEKAKSLISDFANFSISQVPRSKNKKADALSKIVSTSFAYLSKQYARGTTVRGGQGYAIRVLLANHAACNTCQVHCPMPRNPQQPLAPITAPWPFYKWGIDIAGPFSKGPGKVKFLIVAMDYFTKWIEAKAVATIIGNQVKKFVWDNIVCCFGLPGEIVLDNAILEAKAKLKMTKYYNTRVRGVTFRPGDFVYRSNEASQAMDGGKLGPKWEGPYEFTEALGDRAYRLRSMDGTVLPRMWNVDLPSNTYIYE